MKDYKLLAIPCFLAAVYISLQVVLLRVSDDMTSLVVRPAFLFSPAPYPVVQGVLGASANPVSAKAYVVMDDHSKVVIAAKNENVRFPMASTAKIMTALVGLDQFALDDTLTVSTTRIDGSVVGLALGDTFSFDSLLYGMLLPSGNDAAFAIADNYPGGRGAFISVMNRKAKTLYLFDTHFTDPSGLDQRNETTVENLARLSSIAMKNDTIARIVDTKQVTISNTSRTKTFVLNNLNKLLGKEGVNGIKTGFTDEAGGVLATSQKIGDHAFIIVVMKSKDRFADTQELLRNITDNVKYQYTPTLSNRF